MTSLVARFAENLFWLGRYMERCENLARILEITKTYARHEASNPDWGRVLSLYDEQEEFEAEYGTPDAPTVLWYYVLDRSNPGSIRSSVHMARENARSTRHLISTEMWMQLNVFYGDLQKLRRPQLTVTNLANITRMIIAACQMFEGVAEGTFFRNEAWCFYQLGRYLERADQTTRILDMGYERLLPKDGYVAAVAQWNVLLRSVSGYHAYRNRHPGVSVPPDIATFLLYDREFPRAVGLCADIVSQRLNDIARSHGARRGGDSTGLTLASLQSLIEEGPGPDLSPDRLHDYLDEIQAATAALSDTIAASYFRH